MRSRRRDESGQATVEFVALLPALVVLAMVCWQCVVVGQAVWLSGAAARNAARAVAVGGDERAAARRALPGALRSHVRVTTADSGAVRVVVRVPSVIGGWTLGRVSSSARFVEQS